MRGRGCDLRGVWVDRVVAEPGTFADEGVQGNKETRNEFRSPEKLALVTFRADWMTASAPSTE